MVSSHLVLTSQIVLLLQLHFQITNATLFFDPASPRIGILGGNAIVVIDFFGVCSGATAVLWNCIYPDENSNKPETEGPEAANAALEPQDELPIVESQSIAPTTTTSSASREPTTKPPTAAPSIEPTLSPTLTNPTPAPTYEVDPAALWLNDQDCRSQITIGEQISLVALVSLYFSTKNTLSEGPLYDQGWLSSCDPCAWGRITCDVSTGKIISLDLSSLGLQGRIHSYTGLLTDLEALYLNDNELSGEVSLGLQYLVNANTVRLENNLLWGKIPTEVCNLEVNTFSADCGDPNPRVDCDCCSECF